MSITSGIGLVSGIDTVSLIEQLLSIDSQAKIPIFQRIGSLNASKTALLDVNARVLSLGNASRAFRLDEVFQSVLTSSSNEDVLAATATTKANPGQYAFRVKQLVSNSQKMTGGFVSSDESPLGLDQLSFEWGNGRLVGDVSLADLNGGTGIDRGAIRIKDQAGNESVIDLSEATTLQEVVDAINDDAGVQVVASFDTDRMKIVDESGGIGALEISNEGGSTTATDLGILGIGTGSVLLGDEINTLASTSLLSSLNDGNGVFIRDNLTDFVLETAGGSWNIDLGRVDSPITTDSLLDDLNGGDGITINDDSSRPDFTVISSTGVEVDIDLGVILDENDEVDEEAVTTVGELLSRVNGALADEFGAGQVELRIAASGDRFELVDSLGGGSEPQVVGAGPNGDETASDLRILGTGSGGTITGGLVPNKAEIGRASTIQDLMTRVSEQTDGNVTVTIAPDGEGVVFSAGTDPVTIRAGVVDGSSFETEVASQTLRDLGFSDGDSGVDLGGSRISSGLGTVLLRSLQGGDGLGGGSLTVTDREGDTFTVSNLDQFDTFEEMLVVLGTALSASTVDVSIGLNAEGNGLRVVDSSGGAGNLQISGDAAAGLGLDGIDIAEDEVLGENLQKQYVSLASRLSDLNYGRGIGNGKFKITNGAGESFTVDIGSDSKSLYDVIREINGVAIGVEARLNANGDGLEIVDTAPGDFAIKVETVSGSTARDLGILGEASAAGEGIDGSYEKIVDLDPTDTLNDVVGKINDAGIPVSASVIDTGTGGTPYRLMLSSQISGLSGDLVIDSAGVDIGLATLSEARNAKVFVGEGQTSLLVESDSNTVEDIIEGLTLDLVAASDTRVLVNVSRDESGIVESVEGFVAAFNDVIDRINTYDSYDSETEQRGPLLGDPTVSRVKTELYRTLQQSAVGVDTTYRYLSQVGIRVTTDGKIELDKSKFNAAYEADPDAVANLFTAFEQQGSSSTEISDGISVDETTTTYTALGFGDLFKQLADRMTNSIDGTLTLADRQYETLLEAQDDRIERIDERLEAKRLRLQREFAAMEESLARLQSQQSSLGAISQNLGVASALIG
ncbi:MAG: flagellar filament capping protein FliD [Planctomycetota bacterium]|nr:flagellar filament capping protein FliD [Planctomycetota bacterium]